MFVEDSHSTTDVDAPQRVNLYTPVFVEDPDDSARPSIQSIQAKPPHKCWFYLKDTIKTFGYIILGLNILYLCFLIAMLHPTLFNITREYLSGHNTQPLPQIEPNNCNLTWQNIISCIDIWMIRNFVIAFFYTLAIRNRLLMWINAVMWNVIKNVYFSISMFHMTAYKECWFDIIVFHILIANALGIEAALLVLKYSSTVYPPHDEWFVPIQKIGHCSCGLKWFFILFNLLFFASIVELGSYAFIVYTFWLDSVHWLLVSRAWVLLIGSVGVFAQLYEWMYQWTGCCTRDAVKQLYWIMLIGCIIVLETGLTIKHYLKF